MSGWKKVRNLFWVSDESQPDSAAAAKDGDPAEVMQDRFALPKSDTTPDLPSGKKIEDVAKNVITAPAQPARDPEAPAHAGAAVAHGPIAVDVPQIDFQALYDEAEVPNTDEVEALETFLDGLEDSLPQTSKLSAAKAFLRAIGKSPDDVMNDAAQKIRVVRALLRTKEDETHGALESEQKKIDAFQRQIERLLVTMEQSRLMLEGLRRQCEKEEHRLQAARIFFGHMSEEGK